MTTEEIASLYFDGVVVAYTGGMVIGVLLVVLALVAEKGF